MGKHVAGWRTLASSKLAVPPPPSFRPGRSGGGRLPRGSGRPSGEVVGTASMDPLAAVGVDRSQEECLGTRASAVQPSPFPLIGRGELRPMYIQILGGVCLIAYGQQPGPSQPVSEDTGHLWQICHTGLPAPWVVLRVAGFGGFWGFVTWPPNGSQIGSPFKG